MEVPTILSKYLSDPEIDDLKMLVKHREWTALLKLFKELEREVALEFEGFKNADDALEKRGKLHGIRLGVEIVTNLYGGELRYDRSHGNPRQAGGITTDPNPGDEPASGPSY